MFSWEKDPAKFSWDTTKNEAPPRKPQTYKFSLPYLPKPHFKGLKDLTGLFKADQWEVICVLIQLALAGIKFDPTTYKTAFREALASFRATAPSETNLPKVEE